jgi:effector-binding domain-containing protein
MRTEIIEKPLNLDIYGFSGTARNKDYAGAAFKLSGKMWDVVKGNGIKNKGKNIWVYDTNESVFAGVELDEPQEDNSLLERKTILLDKYAYFKHIGPYNLIKQVGQSMIEEIKQKGFETSLPYIEIYGHWNSDESKSETELIMSVH